MKIVRVQVHGVAVPPEPTALYRLEKDVPLEEPARWTNLRKQFAHFIRRTLGE